MRGRFPWRVRPLLTILVIFGILLAVPAFGSQVGDAARDRFMRDNPGATVNDGRLFGRPFSVSRFTPIESGGDYASGFLSFVAQNSDLLLAEGGGWTVRR